jgi:hypothetical protein
MLRTPFFPLVSSALLLLLLSERPAEAYIDPGSASYVFQLVAGALLGGVFLLRSYWTRLVSAIRSRVTGEGVRD